MREKQTGRERDSERERERERESSHMIMSYFILLCQGPHVDTHTHNRLGVFKVTGLSESVKMTVNKITNMTDPLCDNKW